MERKDLPSGEQTLISPWHRAVADPSKMNSVADGYGLNLSVLAGRRFAERVWLYVSLSWLAQETISRTLTSYTQHLGTQGRCEAAESLRRASGWIWRQQERTKQLSQGKALVLSRELTATPQLQPPESKSLVIGAPGWLSG